MRIAALERFADPSRRCDPVRVAGPGDEVLTWDLAATRRSLVRELPRAAAGWVGDVPRGERRTLARACLATGGARLGALVRGPELYRRARAGEVDRVACYSAKDFGLARLLGETAGGSAEALARGTQYFGEFAFELLGVVPYAYWLHEQGLLEHTASTADTRCLYYFSPSHEERAVPRRYVPFTEYPVGEPGRRHYDQTAFPRQLDTRRWRPPPYRDVYRSDRFRFERELCIVCNKASSERHLRRGFAPNAIGVELLLAVIGLLRERYQVVYARPRAADIVNDHQRIREAGDIEAVQRAYPDVLTIQELHGDNPDLGFNELQLRLFASCERFVSVLGGISFLASYFGGTNVVYARRGWEVTCGAYDGWFHLFSGARTVAAATPRDLLGAVEAELVP